MPEVLLADVRLADLYFLLAGKRPEVEVVLVPSEDVPRTVSSATEQQIETPGAPDHHRDKSLSPPRRTRGATGPQTHSDSDSQSSRQPCLVPTSRTGEARLDSKRASRLIAPSHCFSQDSLV